MRDLDARVCAAAADGARQIVDVREQAEWDAGHIPGSVHAPYHDIAERVRHVVDGGVETWEQAGGVLDTASA